MEVSNDKKKEVQNRYSVCMSSVAALCNELWFGGEELTYVQSSGCILKKCTSVRVVDIACMRRYCQLCLIVASIWLLPLLVDTDRFFWGGSNVFVKSFLIFLLRTFFWVRNCFAFALPSCICDCYDS